MNVLFSPQTVHSHKMLILKKFIDIYGELKIRKQQAGAGLMHGQGSKAKIELSNSEKGKHQWESKG